MKTATNERESWSSNHESLICKSSLENVGVFEKVISAFWLLNKNIRGRYIFVSSLIVVTCGS